MNLRSDAGSITTEMAVVMAVFFSTLMLLPVFAGRVAQAEGEVQSAAQEAARAATLTGDAGTADAVARQVAASNLQAAGVSCSTFNVTVNVSDFVPGGYVAVAISCVADFGDLTSLGVPGSRTFTGQATEIIDVYRSAP